MKKCEYCGCDWRKRMPYFREEYRQSLCYSCYEHYKLHPINYIPPHGEIHYDDEGRVICHICGRAYDRLSAHLRYKHGIGADDYKEEFGLNRTQRLTSEKHRGLLRSAIPKVDMDKIRVLQQGGNTNKKNRLQAKLNREKKKTIE